MARMHQQIVRDSVSGQRAHFLEHAGLNQPIVRRFALNQMPHAFEFCVHYKLIQLTPDVLTRQIYPAHHAGDEWILIRKTQQPASFFKTVAGLDQNCFFNAASFQYLLKCRRQIILTKNLDVRSHPWIVEPANLPEVLVTIDYIFHLSFDIFHLPLQLPCYFNHRSRLERDLSSSLRQRTSPLSKLTIQSFQMNK